MMHLKLGLKVSSSGLLNQGRVILPKFANQPFALHFILNSPIIYGSRLEISGS